MTPQAFVLTKSGRAIAVQHIVALYQTPLTYADGEHMETMIMTMAGVEYNSGWPLDRALENIRAALANAKGDGVLGVA